MYFASLSKLLAPTVRLGYVIAARACIERMLAVRTVLDRRGDQILERAVAELFEDGTIQRHARTARRVYQQRRDHLLAQLRASPSLRRGFACSAPAGGLALWLTLRAGSAEALCERAHAHGLLLTPGSSCLPRGQLDALRVGFAPHGTDELTRIAHVLARSLPKD